MCLFFSKPDMSRLRLAAGNAIVKLAQEPCYHEIITLEQYQLCALAINVRKFVGVVGYQQMYEYIVVCSVCYVNFCKSGFVQNIQPWHEIISPFHNPENSLWMKIRSVVLGCPLGKY